MKEFLITAFILISQFAISQNMVQGVVYNEGDILPGVDIVDLGTSNKTRTNISGKFSMTTISDSSYLKFSFIGLDTRTILITRDTTLNVSLEYGDYYNTRWLNIGSNFEFINSVVGFQIGNGVDEEPIIHFEDFQDNLLFKVYGQTDFGSNYSYGGLIGLDYLKIVGRTTIEYNYFKYEQSELLLTDINLTSRLRYIRNTGLIIRTGYQKLGGNENIGLGIGFEQVARNFYFGINSRFYFDYFHHEAYFQVNLIKQNLLCLRAVYNRIDDKGLLTVGINYTFVRNKK